MNISQKIATAVVLGSAVYCGNTLADYVVLQSNSEQFAAGQIVTDPAGLELDAGTELVLISDRGETVSLDGTSAAAQPLSTSEQDLRLMLGSLVSHARDEHVSLGGTRGGSGIGIGSRTEGNAPVFSLDPFISGIQCLIEAVNAHVYRGDVRHDLELKVTKIGSGDSGFMKWLEGQHETEWPQEVPIEYGERYAVKREGYMESSVIQLESIPEVSIDQQTTAVVWLAAKKCIPQAEKLLRMLE